MTDFADPLIFGGSAPPVTGLRGGIVIYVDGHPQFMDELELRTDAEVDHILDVYCNTLGLNQICIGPGYAFVYDHHDLPPIDWTKQDPLPLFRKLRARGLHITLAALPDCQPFWDGRVWNFSLIDQYLGPIYRTLQNEGLIDSVRLEWETVAEGSVMCAGVRWLRTFIPVEIEILYHNYVGHLSPGLSWEDEQQLWRNFLAAGANGIDLQCGTPYSRPDAMQAMLYDLWDLRRRALGINSPWGGPLLTNQGVPMTIRNAEYAAYDLMHNQLPWSTAQAYGAAGLTVKGPGDDTALDGI